jgi:hypothetical protein
VRVKRGERVERVECVEFCALHITKAEYRRITAVGTPRSSLRACWRPGDLFLGLRIMSGTRANLICTTIHAAHAKHRSGFRLSSVSRQVLAWETERQKTAMTPSNSAAQPSTSYPASRVCWP